MGDDHPMSPMDPRKGAKNDGMKFDSHGAERLHESTEEKSPSQDDIPELFLVFLGAATCHGAK